MPPIITVDHLAKAYRIGLKEEVPDTLVSAFTGLARAPVRKFRQLRRLNTFGTPTETPTDSVDDQNRAVSGPSQPAVSGPSQQAVLGPSQLETSSRAVLGPNERDTIWALRDVSFEVQEGEVLGVIGRNGAGKSTLLKILSRITEPTSGRAILRGRVSSLLEVGTGFHPELTGRDNVYMNGTILGMTKREIDAKFDEIVDFSGVEKFLDTPIKRYSSGMQVRLAFAVAAHLEPEILIVDEVLAVGDAEFQKKCMGKMQDVAKGGRTILFVSHNMTAVSSLCTRGVALKNGSVANVGPIDDVIRTYLGSIGSGESLVDLRHDAGRRPGTGQATIQAVSLMTVDRKRTTRLGMGEPFIVQLEIVASEKLVDAPILVAINDSFGRLFCRIQSQVTKNWTLSIPQGERRTVECYVPSVNVAAGNYNLTCQILGPGGGIDLVESVLDFEIEHRNVYGTGRELFGTNLVFFHAEWKANNESLISST